MKAFFPGTFDPPTRGHADIIQRASQLCETLIIALPEHNQKDPCLFSAQERLEMLRQICESYPNVRVELFSGLVADYCKTVQIDVIVRGLRALNDLDFELQMAQANRAMSGVETLFLPSNPQFGHISSTLIREIAGSGQYLEKFVPDELVEQIYAKMRA